MDGSFASRPHVSFEVEKVIGTSSDGSYQVQWAPAWVSKFHLVGCEHLIEEFIQQQKEQQQPHHHHHHHQQQQQQQQQQHQHPPQQQLLQQQQLQQQQQQQHEERPWEGHTETLLSNMLDQLGEVPQSDFQMQGIVGEIKMEDRSNLSADISNSNKQQQQSKVYSGEKNFDSTSHECNNRISVQPPAIKIEVTEESNLQTDSFTACSSMSLPDETTAIPLNGSSLEENFELSNHRSSQPASRKKKSIGTTKSKSKHECHICQKQFSCKSSLTSHMHTHSSKKLFQCSHCGKKFFQSSALSRHVRLHKEKSYACTHCDKSFSRKDSLGVHITVHTKKHKHRYSCDACDYTCTRKDILRSHMYTHEEDESFTCDICDKSFKLKRYLTNHIHVHYREKGIAQKIADKHNT